MFTAPPLFKLLPLLVIFECLGQFLDIERCPFEKSRGNAETKGSRDARLGKLCRDSKVEKKNLFYGRLKNVENVLGSRHCRSLSGGVVSDVDG